MPPTVAATNVIGEFEEDIKQYGGAAWGRRVNGDQMVVGVPRALKAQVATGGTNVTTAQRIMQANGIKPGKRPPPLVTPPTPLQPPPLQLHTGGPAAVVVPRQRRPKLADVIEEPPQPGCCFMFFGGGGGGGGGGRAASSPSGGAGGLPGGAGRPGPANDSGHLQAPITRPLTASASGRGAPSVTMTSFRMANQSIKRVPQSARSRAASAAPRAQSAARSDATSLSNWDEASDGEFEELEEFINDDVESMRGENSGVMNHPDSPISGVGGSSRVPSRATSSAYTAGKAAPKSILKSAKRAVSAASAAATVGFAAEGAPLSQADLSYNPVYGSSVTQPIPTYGATSPPGFASVSRVSLLAANGAAAPPPLGAPHADGGTGTGDWLLGGTQSGASTGVVSTAPGSNAGPGAGGPPRGGVSSLKLTAEELLGLLMAQGKLTEHDVQELGLASGAGVEARGSLGGSGGSGSPLAGQPGGIGTGLASVGSGPARPDPTVPPSLLQMRASENGTSIQQRVRFGAPQVVSAGSIGSGGQPRDVQAAGGFSGCGFGPGGTSHRVRFGGDEPVSETVRALALPCGTATAATASATVTTLILPSAGAVAPGSGGGGGGGGVVAAVDMLRVAAPVAEEYEGTRSGPQPPATPLQQHQQSPRLTSSSQPHEQQQPQPQQRQQQHHQHHQQLQARRRGAMLCALGSDDEGVNVDDGEEEAEVDGVDEDPQPRWQLRQQQQQQQQRQQQQQQQLEERERGGGTPPTGAKRAVSDLDSSLDLDEMITRHLEGSPLRRGPPQQPQQLLQPDARPNGGARSTAQGRDSAEGSGRRDAALAAAATATAAAATAAGLPSRGHLEALRLAPPAGGPVASGSGSGSYRASDNGVTRIATMTTPAGSTVRHSCSGHPGSMGPGPPGVSPRGGPVALRLPTAAAAAAAGAGAFSPVAGSLGGPSPPSRPGSACSTTSVTAFGSWAPPGGGGGGSAAAAAAATAPGGSCGVGSGHSSISDSGFSHAGSGGVSGTGGASVPAGAIAGGQHVGARGCGSAGPLLTASRSPGGDGGQDAEGGRWGPEATWPAAARTGMGAVDYLALRKLQSHMRRSGAARSTSTSASGEDRDRYGLAGPAAPGPGAGPGAPGPGAERLTGPRSTRTTSRATWMDGGGVAESSGGPDSDAQRQQQLAGGPSGGLRSVRFTAPVVFELDPDSDDSDAKGRSRDGEPGEQEERHGGWGGRVTAAAVAAAAAGARSVVAVARGISGRHVEKSGGGWL